MAEQKKEKDEHAHQHQHVTLVDIVSMIVLLPLFCLSLGWDMAFGQSSVGESFRKIFNPYIKFFQKHKTVIQEFSAPEISGEWKRQELALKFEKRAATYQTKESVNKKKGLTQIKSDIFADIHNDILKIPLKENSNIPSSRDKNITELIHNKLTDQNVILYQHRHNFFRKNNSPCKSEIFIKNILTNNDYNTIEISA
jgi:hypothetical protein